MSPRAPSGRSRPRDGITSAHDRLRPPRPRALTIAGSDSGGGAGIQADLKTFTVLGVYGMTAVTAVTVQNTEGVAGYEAMPPAIVADHIRAVVTDIGVDAAKTGMLANAAIVSAVADAVEETGVRKLVVDPVSMSKHGFGLLTGEAVVALRAASCRSPPSSRRTCPRPPRSPDSRSRAATTCGGRPTRSSPPARAPCS